MAIGTKLPTGGIAPATAVPRPSLLEPRRATPVKWWALAGGLSWAMCIYVWSRWVLSGNFETTPSGPTPIPHFMKVSIIVNQVLTYGLMFISVYYFFVRPWRRDRRLNVDGMLILALLSCYWMELLANAIKPAFLYNTGFIQFGSWANFIPGVVLPRANMMSEPIIWEWPLYIVYCLPPIIFTNYLMRRAKTRWPRIGTFGLISIAVGVLSFFDLLADGILIRLGLYTFPTGIKELTLFHGHYYQLPLYEALFVGAWLGALASVRYFVDDKGRTVAEKGVDKLQATPKQKTWLRLAALCGIFNVAFFFCYHLPMGLVGGLYGDEIPQDIQKRSYFMNNLCGEGTTYACPSPKLPIATKDSSHVTPDGKLAPAPGDNDN